MTKPLDAAALARIRATLAAARTPSPEKTFVDDLRALERAFDDLLASLEAAR
jgi:hypothetical protein